MHRLRSPLAAAAFLTLLSSTAASQPSEIRGASIALVPRTVDVKVITIENRHSSALTAWELRWSAPDGAGWTSASDHSADPLPRERGAGPIQPNERRTIDRPFSQPPGIGAAAVGVAVFSDGSIFGAPDAIQRWVRAHEQQRDETAYWVRAFENIPEGEPELAKRYLAARLVERASNAHTDPSGTRGKLAGLWQNAPYNPGPVREVVARVQREVEQQHAALARILAAARIVPGPAPLAIIGNTTTTTEYAVAVTNVREAPIEALGFTVAHAAENRPRSSQSMDFCMAPPADPNGRIAPGETRLFHLGARIRELTQPWEPRLVFVLFDDLVVEGSPADLDDTFRRREWQADDIAFANAVRLELASVPDAALRAFLGAKRAERTKHLLASGRRPEQPRLDEMIEQAVRSPAELRRIAPLLMAVEEEQRERLVRHRR